MFFLLHLCFAFDIYLLFCMSFAWNEVALIPFSGCTANILYQCYAFSKRIMAPSSYFPLIHLGFKDLISRVTSRALRLCSSSVYTHNVTFSITVYASYCN